MIRFTRGVRKSQATPVYAIGTASQLCGLPIWTLRWIEGHKLLRPGRTDGNQRLYCDQEIALLVEVRNLLKMKVNLAGIRVILRLKNLI